MTSETSVRRELAVDLVHLLELVVGHVGLGQQHVHVARHAPGDRVDRVLDLDAALLELLGHLAHRVLGLGDGHAVAGHDDDLAGVGELDRDVRRRWSSAPCRRARRPRPRRPRRRRRRSRRRRSPGSSGSSPRPSGCVRIVPEAPTIMPATISAVLSSAMPVAAALRPVNALSSEITTGMSAPPIGSTTKLPSSARGDEQGDHQALAGLARRRSPRRRPTAMTSSSPLSSCCAPPIVIGLPGQDLLQLGEGDVRAPERDRADDRREQREDRDVGRLVGEAAGLAELDPGDERDRAAADAVEQRDHLRHRGHLHVARGRDADDRADDDAERDQAPVAHARVQEASRGPRRPCRRRRCGCRAPRSSGRSARSARR